MPIDRRQMLLSLVAGAAAGAARSVSGQPPAAPTRGWARGLARRTRPVPPRHGLGPPRQLPLRVAPEARRGGDRALPPEAGRGPVLARARSADRFRGATVRGSQARAG